MHDKEKTIVKTFNPLIRFENQLPTRRGPAMTLMIALLALTLAGGLEAANPHAKKQAELAPNSLGDFAATAHGTSARFAGIPHFTYAIECSNDATNWTTIRSIVAPANGLMEISDTNSTVGTLFYRTVAR